ncbi:hypothetical protein [Mameliella sediminis]|uniref:hypothetical protein n=1 Tax=Mameliella sediminis TaxID=2836866 RepID=UPI001C496362|nr:hypothetical protein [Mameliella sediminis]MBV7393838.1 hypothetical protein [Mameliella sediminis]
MIARVAGTCTGGDADRLYGVVLSLALYGIGLLCLWSSSKARSIVLLSLPILPIIPWQLWFSSRLSFEILAKGHSACTVLEGPLPGYPNSGSELFFALSWPLMAFSVLLGIFAVLRGKYIRAQASWAFR